MSIMLDRTKRISDLLSELNTTLKMSITKATEIGLLLSEQKDNLNHGEFIPWLKENFEMSWDTANRYIKLYLHTDKISNLLNLQDAYKQIEQIEYQEKKNRNKQDISIILEYKNTGIKPEGWERRHDTIYKNMLDEEEYSKRKDEAFSNESTTVGTDKQREYAQKIEENSKIIDRLEHDMSYGRETTILKDKLRLANRYDNLNQDVVVEHISDFISSGASIDDKIQRANNIIILIRNIAVKLQQEKATKLVL